MITDRRWRAGGASVALHVHAPDRPSWACAGCGLAWPCPQVRAALLLLLPVPQVAAGMWAQLTLAAPELPEAGALVLWERFVAWTRPGIDHHPS